MQHFLFLVLLISGCVYGFRKRDSDEELYEIRIFENAPTGTKATLNEALDRALRERKNCFAQMESEVDWIEFDPGLSMFITTQEVPASARSMQHATLHLMCASNQMKSINFAIHVTRRNRHPPKFSQESYHFYVPVSLPPDSELGRVHVIDHDPIIYNSQIRLSILGKETYWKADTKNGSILVRSPMTTLELFKEYNIQLVAIDFGSPQLFSIANVTIVPVSITSMICDELTCILGPFNVRVNVANTGYQIFEWDSPEYGIADKFRLMIKRNRVVVHKQEVDGQNNMAMTKLNFHPGTDYSIVVKAIDIEGETPSEVHKFSVIGTSFECDGQCAEGGIPMCFYGKFHKIEQYRDKNGLHCLCYDGYSSPQCDSVESCGRERVLESFGMLDWPETPVNKSITIPCPYNFDGRHISRRCLWDPENEFARWENISQSDVCRKQSTVLVHLGMLANFVEREVQRVSGFAAAQQFLDNLIAVPAFSQNISAAHFDAKIAEHTAQVLDALFSRNMSEVSGNTTMIRQQLVDYVHKFSKRLPVPYTLESPKSGLQMKTFQWEPQTENFPLTVGRRCYVHLPKQNYNTDNVRVICIRNTTVFPVVNAQNPIMSIEMDLKTKPPPGSKILIAIRPFNATVNHTCAHYDSKERGWSTSGITVLSRNFEDGFVLCETTHLSVFTLLPESLFQTSTSYVTNVATILPIITSCVVLLCTVFLSLVSVLQRNKNLDPALLLFLFTVFIIHFVYLVVLTLPRYISLQHLDRHIYLLLQYVLVSAAALLAFINSSLYSKLVNLESDIEEPAPVLKLLVTLTLSVVVPAFACFVTYFFDGYIISGVTTKYPIVEPFNWVFALVFVLPIVVLLGVGLGYGGYAFYYGSTIICGTSRWSEQKASLVRDLTNAAGSSFLVVLLMYGSAFMFYQKNTITRNLIFAMLQAGYALAMFIFVGYLFRLQMKHDTVGSTDRESPTGGFRTVNGTGKRSTRLGTSNDHDRLLDHVDRVSPNTRNGFSPAKSSSASPAAVTLYSAQETVQSNLSDSPAYKPAVDSLYIDDGPIEQHSPLVSVV